jgi:DNA-binding GntR family transcriptional regulator
MGGVSFPFKSGRLTAVNNLPVDTPPFPLNTTFNYNSLEKEICKEFRVSRTPYREALIQLEAEDLVELQSNKGAIVSPIELNFFRDIFEIRAIFENVATRMAFKKINFQQLEEFKTIVQKIESLSETDDVLPYLELDAEFHDVIQNAQGNKILAGTLIKLRDQCIRLWNSIENQDQIKSIMIKSIRDIRKIYDAFTAKDLTEVEKQMNNHFALYLRTIAAHLLGGSGIGLGPADNEKGYAEREKNLV